MYELKKIGNVFTSKFVGTGPSSYEKRIYWAVVSQRLRNPSLNCLTSYTSFISCKGCTYIGAEMTSIMVYLLTHKPHSYCAMGGPSQLTCEFAVDRNTDFSF
jgi:hypothetical protein